MSDLIEDLIVKANVAENKGCYTCRHYDPDCETNFQIVDDERRDDEDSDFEPEAYWVWCGLHPEDDTSLRINCGDWKPR
jgi:hypothetical protein